jgi:hypothetical protein
VYIHPKAFALLLAGPLVFAGCGPSYPESEYPSQPPPGVTVGAEDLAPAPPGALWRRDVNAVLDEGLGRFLQHAELDPEVQAGAFVGFRVLELRPAAWWQGVDLVPGDIVMQVNGMPIEQPTEAHAAFESLRQAAQLRVKYMRKGEARELLYSILDKPPASPTPGSTISDPPTPAPAAVPAAAAPAAAPVAPAAPAPAAPAPASPVAPASPKKP